MIDERTEQLINRRLDGELSEDEGLELDKTLIRSPEARTLADGLQDLDLLAHRTLDALFENQASPPISAGAVAQAARSAWHRRVQCGLGTIAAALLLIASLPLRQNSPAGPAPTYSRNPARSVPLVAEQAARPPARLVSENAVEPSDLSGLIAGPRQLQKQIDRDVLGVVDPETQSIYLLELQTNRDTVRGVRANY